MRELSDEELLRLTPKRPAAFDVFYVRHERLVVAYFRRRTASADLAVDLTAETFVAALASAKRFRPGETPAVAWLLGIARHKLLRSIERGRVEDRARRRLGARGSTPTPTVAPSPAGTPRAMPKFDPKDLRATPVAPDASGLEEALSLLDTSHQVVRAWKVRGLEGHVLLTR